MFVSFHYLYKKREAKSFFSVQNVTTSTGKSFSEALILESVNPQYDEILFFESPPKYEFTICCTYTNTVLNVKVHNML